MPGQELAFCTFGMFIIDEIEYHDGRDKTENILGGAGAYAALGARLAAIKPGSVSWIVDRGSDFPDELAAIIDSWQTSVLYRTNLNRLTTRAWNGYGANQHRAFKYLTAKQRLEERDLDDSQILASSFHMVCSPTRCVSLCAGIRSRRSALDPNASRPAIVWEPVPDLCVPEELENLRTAAGSVSVISPNGEEFASFFSSPGLGHLAMVDRVLGRQPDSGFAHPAFVIREGAQGSFLVAGDWYIHLPAYHQNNVGVVDPTGGGNTFLGALALALAGKAVLGPEVVSSLGQSWSMPPALAALVCAVIHGTIAASFAIEQVGVPVVAKDQPDVWNGQSYTGRFQQYLCRERAYLEGQLDNPKARGRREVAEEE
ncbi:hypothetical protein DV735_g2661, partial [Chaetothyriales sp. CBS 134920]